MGCQRLKKKKCWEKILTAFYIVQVHFPSLPFQYCSSLIVGQARHVLDFYNHRVISWSSYSDFGGEHMELTWPLKKPPVVYYPPIPQTLISLFFGPNHSTFERKNDSHLRAQITIRIPQLIQFYRMPILVSTPFLPFRGIGVEH